jgi:glycosidase
MDGIREDTYNYPDPRFMADWGKAVMEEYPNFNIVGEIWEFPASFPASFQKDTFFPNEFEAHLPAVTDFPLMVALRDFVTGAGIRTVYRAFTQDFVYADYNNTVTFIDNHDTPRIFDIARGRIDRIKLGLAMLLTTRGIPQILYGTEIGLLSTGEQHSQIRSDFTGGFPGDPRNAFTKEGRTPEENALFDYLRKLLNLREEYPALALGKMVHWIPKDEIYMYKKTLDDKCIVIIVNESNEERQIDLSNVYHWFHGIEELHNLLSGESIPFERELDLRLAGMQVGIFELREPSQD